MMEPSTLEAPRHNVVDSRFDAKFSTITVMCYGTKFRVEVQSMDLKGTVFLDQYVRLVNSLQGDEDDLDEYEKMCDWMLFPCFPILRDVASPPPQSKSLTLHDFYHPPTYRLKLFVLKRRLVARRMAGRISNSEDNLMVKTSELPPFPGVARVSASALTIVPINQIDDAWCEIPRKVRAEDGKEYCFKPAFERSQLVREVEVLTRLARTGLQDRLKISRLAGIVISEKKRMTLGLLIEWIPSIGDLQSMKVRSDRNFHALWEHQVTEIVRELHRQDIVWGDVHPGNIVVDEQMNAWVVDFGGGWVEPFTSRKTCGTVEGDLQGIQKVFEHLRNENTHSDLEQS